MLELRAYPQCPRADAPARGGLERRGDRGARGGGVALGEAHLRLIGRRLAALEEVRTGATDALGQPARPPVGERVRPAVAHGASEVEGGDVVVGAMGHLGERHRRPRRAVAACRQAGARRLEPAVRLVEIAGRARERSRTERRLALPDGVGVVGEKPAQLRARVVATAGGCRRARAEVECVIGQRRIADRDVGEAARRLGGVAV